MYNINTTVDYFDNASYRSALRKVVNMDISNINVPFDQMDDDLDNETIDELLFDNDAMTRCMDSIYKKTKSNDIFKEFYTIAANKMFSEDPNIGLAICFSYDYFYYFHKCLVDLYENDKIQKCNYENMKNKLC